MTRYKGLLTIGILLLIASSSLYVIYSSIQTVGSSQHQSLSSLLAASEGANVRKLEGTELQEAITQLQALPEWASAESFLSAKGFVDPSNFDAFEALVAGYVINILRARTEVSANMGKGMAEIILTMDNTGMISAWILVTNLPPETDSFFDVFFEIDVQQEARSIPVTVWSNGMPVFYVTFYHLIGGVWVPYHYLWNDAENHPNWYYSYYYWWWWYYDWYGIEWVPWYDWFFGWYYHQRFYYWSTWFPIGEPIYVMALFLPILLVLGRWERIRQSVE